MALKFPQLHVVENNKKSLGIYVHIPFCRSKCEYCDFYSLPGARDKDRMDEYTAALVAHIREAATGANGYEVDTVYFGGCDAADADASAPRGLQPHLDRCAV